MAIEKLRAFVPFDEHGPYEEWGGRPTRGTLHLQAEVFEVSGRWRYRLSLRADPRITRTSEHDYSTPIAAKQAASTSLNSTSREMQDALSCAPSMALYAIEMWNDRRDERTS